MWDISVLNWRNMQADINLRPPRETGWVSAVSMSHWFGLCVSQSPPPSPTELLNMFEGLRRFSSVIGRAFILPTSELLLVGRRRMGRREVVGRGGAAAALKSAWWDWSFIGWKRSQRSCKGLRTWIKGSFWNFPHRHERDELLFSARSPSLHQHIRKHTHKTILHIQANKHTLMESYKHAYTHIWQHTQKHTLASFFIRWLARWGWALIGPRGDWQGERSNKEARKTTGVGVAGRKGPLLHKKGQNHNRRVEIIEWEWRQDEGEKHIHCPTVSSNALLKKQTNKQKKTTSESPVNSID